MLRHCHTCPLRRNVTVRWHQSGHGHDDGTVMCCHGLPMSLRFAALQSDDVTRYVCSVCLRFVAMPASLNCRPHAAALLRPCAAGRVSERLDTINRSFGTGPTVAVAGILRPALCGAAGWIHSRAEISKPPFRVGSSDPVGKLNVGTFALGAPVTRSQRVGGHSPPQRRRSADLLLQLITLMLTPAPATNITW